MSEMVERVARKLCRKYIHADDPGFQSTEAVVWSARREDAEWPQFVDLARAAIAAMREPTEKMQVAGATAHVEVAHMARGEGRCLSPGLVWRPMIDAALEE